MFGRTLLAMTLSFTWLGCAEPRYVTQDGNNTANREQKLATCQAKFASGECVSFAWEKLPTETEYGSFLFKTFRPNLADGSPVLENLKGTLAILLLMRGMPHRFAAKIEQLDVGTYRANAFFSMRGEWEIHVQLKNGNEIDDEAVIPITW